MSNVVLGAGFRPALDADEGRRSRGAHDLADVCGRQSRPVPHRTAVPPTDRLLRRGMRERARCPTVRDPATSTTPRCTQRYEGRSADARRRSRCLARGWDTRARSQARATLAVDTYGTAAQSAARCASVLSSSVAAACAGDATITALRGQRAHRRWSCAIRWRRARSREPALRDGRRWPAAVPQSLIRARPSRHATP